MPEPHLWTDGRVFTGGRYAEALLIDQGVVVAVGSDAEVRRAAPTGATATALHGRLVLPGLIDAHLHIADLARFREGLNLTGVRGLDDLLDRIREWAGVHTDGPIVGRGLDVDGSLDGHWPVTANLDRAVPDRPVVVYQASGHAAVVNTRAFVASGVESRFSGPLRDRVGRSSDGTPNGILYEEAVRELGPLTTQPVDPAEVESTLRFLASQGLTTVASMNVSREELALERSLAAADRLPIRVRCYVRLLRLGEFPATDLAPVGPAGRFAVTGTKGFMDGAFGPRTAWLSEPYADAPETSGLPVESDESIASALEQTHARGLAPALHAIGDRAVVRAARLLAPYSRREGAPPRIEHVGVTPPDVLAALDRKGPALVVQPGFVWSDSWLPSRLGPGRTRWAYAFRTLADRGHLLAGSSDTPYDPPDPWRGLRASVERRDELGRSANPEPREALGMEEAVGLYTRNAARALGEPELGSLEPGSRADLLIVEAKSISGAIRTGVGAVRETWVDGTPVYRAPAVGRKSAS